MGIEIGGLGGGGGGGADVIVTASLPAPGAADTTSLYRLTVDNKLYFSDGAAWYSVGQSPTMTAVVSADFSWYNQGGASVASINGGEFLSLPSTASTQFRGRIKAKTAPYTITAAVLLTFAPANFVRVGLFFTDGTKTAVFGISYNTSTAGFFGIASSTFINATTINADYLLNPFQIYSPVVWLRIADDGVNRICSVSNDSINWAVAHTVLRTDFLTATSVGFGGDIENSNAGGLLMLSWVEG